MPVLPPEIRDHLMASSAEFQRLAAEHSRYEAQLEQLTKEPYLSSEAILEEMELKKLKLRVKDEMERIIARTARETGPR